MSTHKEFMKQGGVEELYSGRISNDPKGGFKEIAKGITDNVKVNDASILRLDEAQKGKIVSALVNQTTR